MLNSKYAPIVALTILGVIVILIAGWFLAVKPQFDSVSELVTASNEIDDNTVSIEEQTAKLRQYEADLAAAPSNEAVVSLNLPDTLARDEFRVRAAAAVVESNTEIASFAEASSGALSGWSVASSSLVSNSVAALFATAPIRPDLELPPTYTPVVEPTKGEGPLVENLYATDVTLEVAGSPAEALAFLAELADPDQRLFLQYSVELSAREGESTIAGVSDPAEGDVTLKVLGSLFVLNPNPDFFDEQEPVPPAAPNPDAFAPIGPAPAQPGAN
jgi:hypothetical protein